VTAAPDIGANETRLRVAGANHWVHDARTDRLTHYAYSARRGKEAMDATGILLAYTGTVVSDALYQKDVTRVSFAIPHAPPCPPPLILSPP
jgi:hypothetical protein